MVSIQVSSSLFSLMLASVLRYIPCEKLAMSIGLSQGLSLLLAMILKAIGARRYYDSDDDYAPEKLPLIKNAALHSPATIVVGDPVFASKNNTWNKTDDNKV